MAINRAGYRHRRNPGRSRNVHDGDAFCSVFWRGHRVESIDVVFTRVEMMNKARGVASRFTYEITIHPPSGASATSFAGHRIDSAIDMLFLTVLRSKRPGGLGFSAALFKIPSVSKGV